MRGSSPVQIHPGRWKDPSVPFTTNAPNGIGWVRFTVKDDDARVWRNFRRLKPGGEPRLHTVAFEASAPGLWPVAELALVTDKARHKLLLIAHLLDGRRIPTLEIVKGISMGTRLKQKHRRRSH